MESSQTMATYPEIAKSVSPVEFGLESGSYQATYDSTGGSASLAVVAVVATALGREPRTLTPLETVIDTDALDKLATESATGHGTCDSISFMYDGFEIRVSGGDAIEAAPIKNT